MKIKLSKYIIALIILFPLFHKVTAQRILKDCTIHYAVRFRKDSTLVNALKTVYIHGEKCKTDFSYGKCLKSVVIDENSGVVAIVKEMGSDRYRAVLDSLQWQDLNNRYRNIQTSHLDDPVIILGYKCAKALLTLENGSQYQVYYTLDVIPSAKENAFQFKGIPGLVLRYESVAGTSAEPISIIAKSINLMPLSNTLFQTQSKGYKTLRDFNF